MYIIKRIKYNFHIISKTERYIYISIKNSSLQNILGKILKKEVQMARRDYSLVTVVVVAFVVAVIASVVTASITGNVIKVKPDRAGRDVYTKAEIDRLLNRINANSCSGDEVCEVKKISSNMDDVVILGSLLIEEDGGFALINPEPNGNLIINTAEYGKWINDTESGNVIFSSSLISPILTISKLSGSGNAYACINSTGGLYRSSTPCA